MIYKYLAILALVAAIAFGAFLKGKAVVQKELDQQRAVWQASYDSQVAETKRIQEAWDSSKEREHEIQERLNVVSADGVTLADKLRQYRARRCAVSNPAGSTTVPDLASGVPGSDESIERRTGEVFAACARDAERLTQFQVFYESLRNAQ